MNRIIHEQLQNALAVTTEQANREYPIVARMQESATSEPLPVPVVAELREITGEKDIPWPPPHWLAKRRSAKFRSSRRQPKCPHQPS